MSALLPLKDMTLQEKLEAMEALWKDLAQGVGSPDWHKETLQQRRQRVSAGKAHFNEWETAKSAIRSGCVEFTR